MREKAELRTSRHRGTNLVMQRIGSPLGVELAGADPAPITATSRAVHVVAALRLVGDNTALRALLAIFLDARCCGLLNDGVAARPIGAGLTNVRVAVGETVTEKRY